MGPFLLIIYILWHDLVLSRGYLDLILKISSIILLPHHQCITLYQERTPRISLVSNGRFFVAPIVFICVSWTLKSATFFQCLGQWAICYIIHIHMNMNIKMWSPLSTLPSSPSPNWCQRLSLPPNLDVTNDWWKILVEIIHPEVLCHKNIKSYQNKLLKYWASL